jgi:hypothetical protein
MSTNEQHAQYIEAIADRWVHSDPVAKALRAGAKALRWIDGAKVALRPFSEGEHIVPDDFDRAAAALAELEAPDA